MKARVAMAAMGPKKNTAVCRVAIPVPSSGVDAPVANTARTTPTRVAATPNAAMRSRAAPAWVFTPVLLLRVPCADPR